MPQSRPKASASPPRPIPSSSRNQRWTRPDRLAFALVTGLLLLVTPTVGSPQAGGPQSLALAEYHNGVVTSNSGTVLQIDGRAYRLHPRVRVTDDEGSIRSIQDLKDGEVIKFHLRDGKIDQIIWILPR